MPRYPLVDENSSGDDAPPSSSITSSGGNDGGNDGVIDNQASHSVMTGEPLLNVT